MLYLLQRMVRRLPFQVGVIAVHLDQKAARVRRLVAACLARGETIASTARPSRSSARHVLGGDVASRRCGDLLLDVLAAPPRHPLHGGERLGCNKMRSATIGTTRSRRS